jgi:Ca2+-binding RTX toxin-like protein
MATVDVWHGTDLTDPDLTGIQDSDTVSGTAKRLELFNTDENTGFVFVGKGFTYDMDGVPTAGKITSFTVSDGTDLSLSFKQLSFLMTDFVGFVQANDGGDLLAALFAGRDVLTVHSTDETDLRGFGENDKFDFGNYFVFADSVDGGDGTDSLLLSGNYGAPATPFVFAPDALFSIEKMTLSDGQFFLKTDNANIAAGATLIVDGTHSNLLVFNAAFELDGNVEMTGGNGADALVGGQQDDVLKGGEGKDHLFGLMGHDQLTGGGGADTFVYGAAAHSLSSAPDWITDYDGSADTFDLPFAVSAVLAPVTANSFKALAGVLDAAHFGVHAAVVATVGTHLYLVVDMDGTAGFNAASDLVIKIDGAVNLDHLTTADFV